MVINIQNWNKVYDAIQKNHKLRFRYTKPYTNTEAQRTVWPYQLILDNGSVYLWAYSKWKDYIFLYDLNYMTDILVLNEEFELPEDYEIKKYSGGGRLGAFAGDNVEEFKIRFTGYAKNWIKQHKWAIHQKKISYFLKQTCSKIFCFTTCSPIFTSLEILSDTA